MGNTDETTETTEPAEKKEEAKRPPFSRKQLAIAAALAVAIGGGAVYAGTHQSPTPAPSDSAPTSSSSAHPSIGKLDPSRQANFNPSKVIKDTEVTDIAVNLGMGDAASLVTEVKDGDVIVSERHGLADKYVAERTFDRALKLADGIGGERAKTVTWVIDNGKDAKAAVTVKADTSGIDKDSLTNVAKKLESAEAYTLSDKAYEPIKDRVQSRSVGTTPTGVDGNDITIPSKAPQETKQAAQPKTDTPATETEAPKTEDTPTEKTETTETETETTKTESTDSEPSSTPTTDNSGRHWVEEQYHWEDVYDDFQVGTRYVVDKEAYREDVPVWIGPDGQTYNDQSSAPEGSTQQIVSIYHEEEGHEEPIYEKYVKERVKVVDVEGHYE